MKIKTVEQLAKEYRKTTPNQMYGDELGFIAGYKKCEELLRRYIEFVDYVEGSTFLKNKTPILTDEEREYLDKLYEK